MWEGKFTNICHFYHQVICKREYYACYEKAFYFGKYLFLHISYSYITSFEFQIRNTSSPPLKRMTVNINKKGKNKNNTKEYC